MSLDSIEKKVADLTLRLDINKMIFRRTEMALFLARVPRLLPEGVWLNDLSIEYVEIAEPKIGPDSKSSSGFGGQKAVSPKSGASGSASAGVITIEMAGMVYAKDSNQQFRLVYNLVDALKADDFFKKYLANVALSSIQSQQKDKTTTITSFRISGK
jgi:hypothetical protein